MSHARGLKGSIDLEYASRLAVADALVLGMDFRRLARTNVASNRVGPELRALVITNFFSVENGACYVWRIDETAFHQRRLAARNQRGR